MITVKIIILYMLQSIVIIRISLARSKLAAVRAVFVGLLRVKMLQTTCVTPILISALLFGGLSDVLCDEVHYILPSSD